MKSFHASFIVIDVIVVLVYDVNIFSIRARHTMREANNEELGDAQDSSPIDGAL